MKGNENKSGKSRTAIVILAAAAVILLCILLAMHGCNGGNDESEDTESGVSSENESSDVLNGVHSGDSDDTFSCGAADGEPSAEPSESGAVSESDISDNSAEISAESDEPDESDYTVSDDSHVNSRPNEESEPVKPVDNPKPLDPPVTEKVYHTEWGTRPHEFEEQKETVNQTYGETNGFNKLMQHSDGYGNTWFTVDGKLIGNGSIFDHGSLSLADYAMYFGYGFWSNGFYYWSEDKPLTICKQYGNIPLPSNKYKYQGKYELPTNMPYGQDLQYFWEAFIDNYYGALNILTTCSDLDQFKNIIESEVDRNPNYAGSYLSTGEFYIALNIHSYEDLANAISDPFSYQFSSYTHKF